MSGYWAASVLESGRRLTAFDKRRIKGDAMDWLRDRLPLSVTDSASGVLMLHNRGGRVPAWEGVLNGLGLVYSVSVSGGWTWYFIDFARKSNLRILAEV